MQAYQRRFIEFALSRGVLKFGSFVLKSGRISPYFFNAGSFASGEDLSVVAACYAQAIVDAGVTCNVLFGPAYKGIPLACATAMELARAHRRNVNWCFNRKEKKDHGEGGNLVGAPLKGEIMLIDDVITAGTAVRQAAAIITAAPGAHFKAAVIALDRQEKGSGDTAAITELEHSLNIRVLAIVTLSDLTDYVAHDPELKAHLPAMEAYRREYGA